MFGSSVSSQASGGRTRHDELLNCTEINDYYYTIMVYNSIMILMLLCLNNNHNNNKKYLLGLGLCLIKRMHHLNCP